MFTQFPAENYKLYLTLMFFWSSNLLVRFASLCHIKIKIMVIMFWKLVIKTPTLQKRDLLQNILSYKMYIIISYIIIVIYFYYYIRYFYTFFLGLTAICHKTKNCFSRNNRRHSFPFGTTRFWKASNVPFNYIGKCKYLKITISVKTIVILYLHTETFKIELREQLVGL